MLRWGLVPPWANAPGAGPNLINARSETAAERPAFRGAFARMRCLILADGFFEWRMGAAGRKEAFHITQAGDGFFAFAGLWSVWRGPGLDGATLRSCAILTTAANAAVAPLHERMPVILARDAEDVWLDPGSPQEELVPLLRPLAVTQTVVRAVGPAVNDARYDGPECLAPAQASAGQPALF